uniref:glutathione transferase n=1 Tax=Panagrolaimus davidi TaxID=227884 RepID=A0A914P3U4_9BILA
MVHYKLTYFDARGLGEAIRLIFKYANIEFEDIRFHAKDWPKIKPTTPAGKVPILEFDGNYLVESAAICRYLARKHGLAGKGDLEEAKVDAIVDQNKDFHFLVAQWIRVKYGMENGNEKEMKEKIVIPQSEIYLPLYQKYLKESGSGFLVKSGLTFADFIVSEFLITLRLNAPEVLEEYPEILQYLDRMKNIPQLKEYYATRKEEFNKKCAYDNKK